jgi:glucose-6-phosphate 1-dehydrogenase
MVNQQLTLPTLPAPGDPCVMVIFGASGDLTKRLLMPALYNLACDGLLPDRFALVGCAREAYSSDTFRDAMTHHLRTFCTRDVFDVDVWDRLSQRLFYLPGSVEDLATFRRLRRLVRQLDRQYHTAGNLLFYMATPPAVFGTIAAHLAQAGFRQDRGWQRLIIEKPFGYDLSSAQALNRELLTHWTEAHLFRIDHYLGKETVQNLLAFRFSNQIFEPLWSGKYIDHIQCTVAEQVGVENRGRYYDQAGVIRDMMQNHIFQMLAYLCMEPPKSFEAEAIRDAKADVLAAVRILTPEDVQCHAVRGQYGAGTTPSGQPGVAYRDEPHVAPDSSTETFAALKLAIDNERWSGVPMYLRSGKALWKKDTEIVIHFKKTAEHRFQGTPAMAMLEANQLIFHIQPDQGIELRFQAKQPGVIMQLQKVNMRFAYSDAFTAPQSTGYEVMLYDSMIGDTTLFSRTDLVETAWRIAQPILDAWSAQGPADWPNYPVGSWGPKAAFDLIERDGRRWVEVINRDVLERVPLFAELDAIFLHNLALMLQPVVARPGDWIIRKGALGQEMYIINRGQVDVVADDGTVIATLSDGNFFGEIGILLSRPRTASVRAMSDCDLFMLAQEDFWKALRDRPQFAASVRTIAHERYHVTLSLDRFAVSVMGE